MYYEIIYHYLNMFFVEMHLKKETLKSVFWVPKLVYWFPKPPGYVTDIRPIVSAWVPIPH